MFSQVILLSAGGSTQRPKGLVELLLDYRHVLHGSPGNAIGYLLEEPHPQRLLHVIHQSLDQITLCRVTGGCVSLQVLLQYTSKANVAWI